MAKQRIVDTRFWADTYICDLDPIEKLLFLYFLTNPHTDICGVYELPLRHAAIETGIDQEMVKKIVKRFTKDKKIFYQKGWIGITNFRSYQAKNPKIARGIEIGLGNAPFSLVQTINDILNKKSQDPEKQITPQKSELRHRLSHSNTNSNPNPNLNSNPKIAEAAPPFSFKEEIDKLEAHKSRALQIMGLYFSKKKPDIRSKEQLGAAIKRHIRSATALVPFEDDQIIKAFRKAENMIEGWTIETAGKILTK